MYSDKTRKFAGVALAAFVALVLYAAVKDSTRQIPAGVSPQQQMRSADASVNQLVPQASAADRKMDGLTEHPAAVPASAQEWASIQKYAKAVWRVELASNKAHDLLMQKQTAAARNVDIPRMLSALQTYLNELKKLRPQLLDVDLPVVADADANLFIGRSHKYFTDSLELEIAKNDFMIDGILNGNMPSNDEMKSRNFEINKATGLGVLYLQRLFWQYGYESADLNQTTMNVKPGIKPKATVLFNRGDN